MAKVGVGGMRQITDAQYLLLQELFAASIVHGGLAYVSHAIEKYGEDTVNDTLDLFELSKD